MGGGGHRGRERGRQREKLTLSRTKRDYCLKPGTSGEIEHGLRLPCVTIDRSVCAV